MKNLTDVWFYVAVIIVMIISGGWGFGYGDAVGYDRAFKHYLTTVKPVPTCVKWRTDEERHRGHFHDVTTCLEWR